MPDRHSDRARRLAFAGICGAWLLQGCSTIETRQIEPWARYAAHWRNAISVGEPSSAAREVIDTLELEATCRRDYGRCADSILAADFAMLGASRWLAAAELDYLAARRGDEQRYWNCAESAYRILSQDDLVRHGAVPIGSLVLSASLYSACLERAVAPLTVAPAGPQTPVARGRYRVSIDWPAAMAAGASVRAASEIDVSGFRHDRIQAGIGAAYVLVPGHSDAGDPLRPPGGLVRPLTAIATFGLPAAGETHIGVDVRFADPYAETRVSVGGFRSPPAADYTAPLALMVGALDEAVDRIRRLVRPGWRPDLPEVYAVTPYDPDRVTIVMIHGLGSGPRAWLDLTNELLGDAGLRSRIQVWHCRYASGYPVLYNRKAIAQSLARARRAVDPELDDRGTQDVVLIGHSMGGVLARLLVSASGTALWQSAFPGAESDLTGTPEDIEAARGFLTFDPLPFVSRAIFVAAPQRGAPLAGRTPGRALGALIELPSDTFDFLTRLAQDNPAAVDPRIREEFLRGGPRSVDVLSPDHPIVRASIDLPIAPGVPVHVISGTGWPVGGEPGDGLVAVSSTLVDGAESTLLVRATHEVQKNPRAILEIKRILREHITD